MKIAILVAKRKFIGEAGKSEGAPAIPAHYGKTHFSSFVCAILLLTLPYY